MALAVFGALAPSFFLGLASAQQQEDPALQAFMEEIRTALAVQDEAARLDALFALYHLEGSDDEARSTQRRVLAKLLEGNRLALTGVEPLATLSEYVVDGIRYGPNLAPSGYAVFATEPATASAQGLSFTSRVPFGRTPDGHYRFIAMVKRAETAGAPKDSWITIMLSGRSAQGGILEFSGSCMLRQSDGTERLIEIDDEGLLSHSIGWRGIGIAHCLVEKTAGPGHLRLQILRDEETLFDRAFEGSAPAIFEGR